MQPLSPCTPLASPLADRVSCCADLRSERRPVPGPISTFPGSHNISFARSSRVGVVLVSCVLVATCSSRAVLFVRVRAPF